MEKIKYDGTSPWKNFSIDEIKCQHTGRLPLDSEGYWLESWMLFMHKLQLLRDLHGYPIKVSSMYRHKTHPIELKKTTKGQHTVGACDIVCSGQVAYKLLTYAIEIGFTGLGFNQSGEHSKRFLHVDNRPFADRVIWSY